MSIKCATILLVDDEASIRAMLNDYLKELEFNVITASNGDEAIAIVNSKIKIDLLITDIIMPGDTDGLSLIEYTRRVNPQTRTIAMSGFVGVYSRSIDISDKFISKPFTFLALEREINLIFQLSSGVAGR